MNSTSIVIVGFCLLTLCLGCSLGSKDESSKQIDNHQEVVVEDTRKKCSLKIELLDGQNSKVTPQREPLGDPYIRLVIIDEGVIRYTSYSEPDLFNDVTEGRIAITIGKGGEIEALHKEDLKCGSESVKTIQIRTGTYVAQSRADAVPKTIELKQPIILSNIKRVEKARKRLSVGVILNEEGKVISARLIEGDKEFQSFRAMEQSAVKSKFERALLNGKPIEYSSVIHYDYVP